MIHENVKICNNFVKYMIFIRRTNTLSLPSTPNIPLRKSLNKKNTKITINLGTKIRRLKMILNIQNEKSN